MNTTIKHLKHTFVLLAAACLLALSGCGAAAPAATPETALPAAPEQAMTQPATPEQAPETSPAPATPAPVVPDRIELAATEGILTTGHSWKIRATVLPEEAPDKDLTWTSDNEAVATVDADGVVVGRSAGTAVITVRSNAGSASATYTMYVQDVTCSYCGAAGHTADACPTRAAAQQQAAQQAAGQAAQQQAAEQAAQQQAAEQQAAEQQAAAEQPAQEEEVHLSTDGPWPEGTVVTRPDGSKYVVGPGNVIFGYAENIDPNDPATSPIVGRCTFCGDPDHDIYHCPLLQEDVAGVKGVN